MGHDESLSDDPLPPLVVDAAEAASAETADAIDRAAELNEDPAVGDALDIAAAKADQTVSRVGWLRSFLHRLFGPSA